MKLKDLKEKIDKLYNQSDNAGDTEVLLIETYDDGLSYLSDSFDIEPMKVFKTTHKDGSVFEYRLEEYLVYVCNKPKTAEDAGLTETKVDVIIIG
jgi:hypothetical protein